MANRYLLPMFLLGLLATQIVSGETPNPKSDSTSAVAARMVDTQPFTGGVSTVEPIYTPVIFGTIKTRFEVSTERGEYRFSVRNSRLGARGQIGPRTRYGIQMELSSDGKFSVLDSYLTFYQDRFELTVGQQKYRFSTELDRGSSSGFFANRSFIAKFITSYYGSTLSGSQTSDFVKSIGARDIGALASYRFLDDFPLRLTTGLFNGTGVNNPEWNESLNFVARLDVGKRPGFGGAVSTYLGHTPVRTHVVYPSAGSAVTEAYKQKLRMWGAELFWTGKRFLLETECAQRILFADDGRQSLIAAHVQGYYRFAVAANRRLEYIAPTARWDLGNGIDFLNEETSLHDRFDAQRVTIGVNFGLAPGKLHSEFRLNFEKYLLDKKPTDFAVNKLLHDKISVEFVASF